MKSRYVRAQESAQSLKESVDQLIGALSYLENTIDENNKEQVRATGILIEQVRALLEEMAERHAYISEKIEETASKILQANINNI
jgi:hypothetical protein